jgi:chromatin segregation and condensation protein Rec8/ScpA/Scc1 (kleisin family)
MDLDLAGRQARRYSVQTPLFEGPLDLLLQLIIRAELDITSLALAQVTEQYLEHIRTLEVSADEISGFLVVAAKLLQIKSEALLPRPPVREPGEEDPGRALADQLMTYRRYKEIAVWLQAREAAGLHTYLRLAPPPKVEGRLDLTDYPQDLLAAAEAVFSQEQDKQAWGRHHRPEDHHPREDRAHCRAPGSGEGDPVSQPDRLAAQPPGGGCNLPGAARAGQALPRLGTPGRAVRRDSH